MGLQFSVKVAGNCIRDTNPCLNTEEWNYCPPDAVNALRNAKITVPKIHETGAVASEEKVPYTRSPPSGLEDEKSHRFQLHLDAGAFWVRGSIPYGEGWCFHQTGNVPTKKHWDSWRCAWDAFLPASLKQLPVGWSGGQIKSSRIYQQLAALGRERPKKSRCR